MLEALEGGVEGEGDVTLEQGIEHLKANGWLEYDDPLRRTVRAFAKIIPSPARCRLNRNRAGINVRCYAGMLSDRPYYDLDLSGELPDQTWVNLKRYA